MPDETIRFGLRRYPLMVVFFLGGGVGFITWSGNVDHPIFLFPLGRREPAAASTVMFLVGIASLIYVAAVSYIRFVRRPVVVLGENAISIPTGEFGLRRVMLRKGDIESVRVDGPRAGGWRTCHIRHRGGALALRSSQLPSDEAFFRICKRLEALAQTSY
jgi:hypothetical protein